jgi:cardiolipin synthase A/B
MIAIALVVFQVLGVVSSIHAVMTTRTEQGAIAWAVSLITFPYVAVPAYWVLGRSRFQGYVGARRDNMEEIAGVTKEAVSAVTPFGIPDAEVAPAARAAQRLAGIPALTGNSVELLVNGDAMLTSILQGIDSAREYVLVEFYIVHDDGVGREFKAHLIERAKAGIRVRFLYDEIGSHDLTRAYIDDLRAAGIEIHQFHTRKGPRNRFQLNFRNHRKIVVVDGKVAWVGGHNIGDESLCVGPASSQPRKGGRFPS